MLMFSVLNIGFLKYDKNAEKLRTSIQLYSNESQAERILIPKAFADNVCRCGTEDNNS